MPKKRTRRQQVNCKDGIRQQNQEAYDRKIH